MYRLHECILNYYNPPYDVQSIHNFYAGMQTFAKLMASNQPQKLNNKNDDEMCSIYKRINYVGYWNHVEYSL